MARLSPQKKQRLKRRAQVEASRESAPVIGAARGQIRQANRDYGRDVADARGAQRVMVSQLNRQLSGIKGTGLRGRYAAQMAADLRSRKAEAVGGVPYAISQAQGRRADAVSDARSAMAEAQAAAQAASGTRFNELLTTARKNKAERIEARSDAKKETREMNRGVKNALVMARALWAQADGEEDRPSKESLIQSPDGFAAQVAKVTKGADATDARRAASRVIREYQRDALKGAFENLYGPQKWGRKRR